MNAPPSACPDTGEIARLAPQGATAELQAHLAACPACADDWRAQREMARLGASLPFAPPEPAQQRRVRAAVMASLAGDVPLPPVVSAPRRRWWQPMLLAGAGGAAAAALLLLVFRSPGQDAAPLVTVPVAKPGLPVPAVRGPALLRASAGARYTRESGPPHERVRLHEGRLLAEVTPALAGESFRIVTARGEVEVRGTVFETVATAAGLQSVQVQRGRVAVRPADGTEIILDPGQHWQRPAARAAVAAVSPARAARPARAPAGRGDADRPRAASHWRPADDVPRPATGDGSPITWPEFDRAGRGQPARPAADSAEAAFGSGLQLLRAGRHDAAADAFDQAARLAPAGPLSEDAWYWRAVALGRGGGAPGRAALAQFLERYPFSARRGEAAVMLGWLLFDSGDTAGAARHFRLGLGDRSARVRASAQAGLARLSGRAASPR